ncbi:MAG: TAT-variant-translocated molybdopterin oxidoreductase [Verrucomicrobia bacterium]|nr:TAT-variant-translocated molybdopterin oxidoreductase [Verrucomicrobiota bacterium]
MSTNTSIISIDSLRKRPADVRRQWRSLDELADTPQFQSFHKSEFPAAQAITPVNRREFMKLMGASMALAGAAGCTRSPKELIVPYVRQPEELVPGQPLYYATALAWQGVGRGVLVESHMGRPTKIEGNPDHPDGGGTSNALMQAAVLNMYDPDRSQTVKYRGRINTWDQFMADMEGAMARHRADQGASLRLLTGPVTSPTLLSLIGELMAELPKARWHRYAPLARDAAYTGSRLAFGEALETRYNLKDADVIFSLDADFLYEGTGSLHYAQQYAARRRPQDGHAHLNRLYVAECGASLTGAAADHRLAVTPQTLIALAAAVARQLGVAVAEVGALDATRTYWVDSLAKDLQAHRGRSVIMVGDQQPPALHALAHALNEALENTGKTVLYTEALDPDPVDGLESLKALTDDMRGGAVQTLVMFGVNPAYDAPSDIPFATSMASVPLCVHWGIYEDETAVLCHWHVAATHDLEQWGDLRAFDGTVSIQQPLIAPLYAGKSAVEMLDAMLGRPSRPGYDAVRGYWEKQRGTTNFEAFWRATIHNGFMADSAFASRRPRLALDLAAVDVAFAANAAATGIALVIRPDPCVWDGSQANNGWLQELPKPMTKLTWENAALVSPSFASEHGLSNGDGVALRVGATTIDLPAWILPGQPANTVTVNLGYGRTRAGRVGNGIGVNVFPLRRMDARWATVAQLAKTGTNRELACTQDHQSMEGRNLVRQATVAHFNDNPKFVHEHEHHGPDTSLYPNFPYEGHKWGMVIDLNTCTGCNACTIACQAENNIAVVGKSQVMLGREMHWIRVDRYFEGDVDDPETHHQPIPCMQCERAPCEVVCPVGATAHSDEGLNDMVYNRCVGTRYCSNNCPYKVRRFNFFKYTDMETPQLKLQRNPDVTVRMRGVMEKCTYCVQRINVARINAKKEDRRVRDGEVVTACQQACPVGAITFGDMNDATSKIAKSKADPRNYGILEDLGVRPRTTYLAKLRNPNPALVVTRSDDVHAHSEGPSHGA